MMVFIVCGVCFGQTQLRRAVEEGRSITSGQAQVLEQHLKVNPFAVEDRAQLIGYYFAQVQKLKQDTPDSVRAARGRHVRWFIENDPGSEVLSTGPAFAMSGWLHDPENYTTMRQLWLAEVERAPENLAILKNATYLLQQHSRPEAVSLMRKAYQITSGNDLTVTDYYGVQLGLLWVQTTGAARKAVEGEIDATHDARVFGSAGTTIVRYSNPGGEAADFGGGLLRRAVALTPDDKIIFAWERELRRIDSGIPLGSVMVAGRVQLAKILHKTDVVAPGGGPGGVVFVEVYIAPDGTVPDAIAISGPKELQSAAAAAVKEWQFKPTVVEGKPVGVFSTFEIRVEKKG